MNCFGRDAEESGDIMMCNVAIENGSFELKYAVAGRICKTLDRLASHENRQPGMSGCDAESVRAEPSKDDFKRFWYAT